MKMKMYPMDFIIGFSSFDTPRVGKVGRKEI
jgi:hypothetical protein